MIAFHYRAGMAFLVVNYAMFAAFILFVIWVTFVRKDHHEAPPDTYRCALYNTEHAADEDDGLTPQLREARANRPAVAVFELGGGVIEYRLIIDGIVFDLEIKDHKLDAWYLYDRHNAKMLGDGS